MKKYAKTTAKAARLTIKVAGKTKRPTRAEIDAKLRKTPGLIGDLRRFVAETGGVDLGPYLPRR